MPKLHPSSLLARPAAPTRALLAALGYAADLLLRCAPVSSALLLACGLAVGVATPLAVSAMQGLVNALAWPGVTWPATLPWLAPLLAAFLLNNVVGGVIIYVASVARQQLDAGLRGRLYAQSLALPLATFEQPEFYGTLETGRGAPDGSYVYMLQYLAQAGSSLVLQQGRLIEEGTHAALLAASGLYAELYRLQAEWYR